MTYTTNMPQIGRDEIVDPIVPKAPNHAAKLVEEFTARSQEFLAECDRNIEDAERTLEFWSGQRHALQHFLASDQLNQSPSPKPERGY